MSKREYLVVCYALFDVWSEKSHKYVKRWYKDRNLTTAFNTLKYAKSFISSLMKIDRKRKNYKRFKYLIRRVK
mgnify:CR=1 FL=1